MSSIVIDVETLLAKMYDEDAGNLQPKVYQNHLSCYSIFPHFQGAAPLERIKNAKAKQRKG